MKRIIAFLLCTVMTLSLCACSESKNAADTTEAVTTAVTSPSESGDTVVVKSQNFSYNYAELQYLLQYTYTNLMQSYYTSYASSGYDYSKDPKEQTYDQTNGYTWFDYFMNETMKAAYKKLYYCEAYLAEGKSLTDSDYATIDSTVETWRTSATDNGFDNLNSFLSQYFGATFTEEALRTYLQKDTMAYNYYNEFTAAKEFTDDELETYYSDNAKYFQSMDCLTYVFKASDSGTSTNETAKAAAEGAAACANADAFCAYVKNYKINTIYSGDSSKVDATELYASLESDKVTYNDDDLGNWEFDLARAVGDTHVVSDDTNGTYTVYMITNPAHREEYNLVNFRLIYFTFTANGTPEKAKTKAQEVLDLWNAGAMTEESFGELAKTNSEDTTSSSKGGLYENMDKSTDDEMFTWLFDASRKNGDVALLSTSTAYHIVYFISQGEIAWKYYVRSVMLENSDTENLNTLSDAYKITTNDAVISQMDIML